MRDDAAPSGYGLSPNGAYAIVPTPGGDQTFNFTNRNPFSLEIWLNPKAHGNTFKGGILGNYGMLYGSYNVGWGLYMNWPARTVSFVRADPSTGAAKDILTSSSLPAGVWTHVVGTYDGTTMKLYVNGQLSGQMTSTRNVGGAYGSSLQIGEFPIDFGITEYPGYFYGSLDEASVYNFALSASQISAHATMGLLDRYAPELRYDSQEAYRADSVSEITDNYTATYTNVLRDGFTIFAAADPAHPADTLSVDYLGATYSTGVPAESYHYLDENDDTRTEDAQRLNAIPAYGHKVYGRVIVFPIETVLQYWFWYYDNPKTFFTFGEHEGDWEMIQLELSVSETLISATYAQHDGGEYCSPSQIEFNVDGHPVVYVAEGSHASYFWAGDHRVVVDGFPDQWDYADGLGGSITPSVINVTDPPVWMAWPGRFGGTSDVSATSPHGPSHQAKWDDPLTFRDEAASCTTAGRQSVDSSWPERPGPPLIRARRAGKNIEVTYEVSPRKGDAAAWLLVTTVDGRRDRFSPTGRRVVLNGKDHGTVLVPTGLARGPLRVSASVRARDGARSETVTVRVR